MQATQEQSAALEAFGTGQDVVITAGAGTGKTSTLRLPELHRFSVLSRSECARRRA